jgi:RND family efflux transporter MFP subunit
VRLQLADEQGFPHEGHMDFVDNQVDPATGTIQGRAVFPNPDGMLTPGLFARVQLVGEGPYDALLVPDQAIGTDQAQRVVYIVGDDNTVKALPVVIGHRQGTLRVVRSGLGANDRVIINGLQRARPGAVVTPVAGTIAEPTAE